MSLTPPESQLESQLVEKLVGLKYEYRPTIRNRAALEKNFREKFEALNRVRLTDAEFARLLEGSSAQMSSPPPKPCEASIPTRDDGTPLNYSLVNLKDWCKTTSRSSPASHQHRPQPPPLRCHPAHQRRALRADRAEVAGRESPPGHGADRRVQERPWQRLRKTLLCFMQMFIVSNRDRTWYFANNNARHFAFNAEERFLPSTSSRTRPTKDPHLDDFAERFLKKCDLGKTISRYMVLLAGEQKLAMMRPYQVYAAAHGEVHRRRRRQRLHLAHHRQRQDAYVLQGLHSPQGKRSTSTNASSSWTARTSTARRAKSSTSSRKAASRKTPTPPPRAPSAVRGLRG